ncbi:MAG: carbohydrate-binding family 9-like protein [Bacteroidetes bacterium]|nr:carbohydrate-binding family 9-like protein [Bacteroidota bacterium]
MKNYLFILTVLLLFAGIPCALAAPQGDTVSHPPCGEMETPHYVAYRTATKPQIDGQLDEYVWKNAPRSPRFRDMIYGEETIHDTRAAVLWDDEYLYVAYWIEESDLQATLTERDAPIYQNNDVEFFIAGRDGYYEFEINSFGTIYEVLFFWEDAYKAGNYEAIKGLAVDQPGSQPFNGVGYKNHPRGPRIGFFQWDLPGLRTAVFLDGTINDSSDRDRGWTVELAIPWEGLEVLAVADKRSLPPEDHDVWRMDFSRFNQYKEAPPSRDPGGWVWSPHGTWDSHVPECFTYIHFSLADVLIVD